MGHVCTCGLVEYCASGNITGVSLHCVLELRIYLERWATDFIQGEILLRHPSDPEAHNGSIVYQHVSQTSHGKIFTMIHFNHLKFCNSFRTITKTASEITMV